MRSYVALRKLPSLKGVPIAADYMATGYWELNNLKEDEEILLFSDIKEANAYKEVQQKEHLVSQASYMAYVIYVEKEVAEEIERSKGESETYTYKHTVQKKSKKNKVESGEKEVAEKEKEEEVKKIVTHSYTQYTLSKFDPKCMFIGRLVGAFPTLDSWLYHDTAASPHASRTYCGFFNNKTKSFGLNTVASLENNGITQFFGKRNQANLKEDSVACVLDMLKDYYAHNFIKIHWFRHCADLAKAVEEELSTDEYRNDPAKVLGYLEQLRTQLAHLSDKENYNDGFYRSISVANAIDKLKSEYNGVNLEGSFMRRLDFMIATLDTLYVKQEEKSERRLSK